MRIHTKNRKNPPNFKNNHKYLMKQLGQGGKRVRSFSKVRIEPFTEKQKEHLVEQLRLHSARCRFRVLYLPVNNGLAPAVNIMGEYVPMPNKGRDLI